MYVIAIREARDTDNPQISEVVRKAYSSNVSNSWLSALFNEVTFQCIILLAAFMFIFMGVPLQYCLASVPMVLVLMYLLIYAAVLVKAAELMHSKRPLKCWVAEAYEPYFLGESPRNCLYRVVGQEQVVDEGINVDNYRKVIIGTCAVMNHNLTDEWAWLFRLAVNEKYRKKGVGLGLIQAAKKWCKDSRFDSIELVITECQEDARQLFTNAGCMGQIFTLRHPVEMELDKNKRVLCAFEHPEGAYACMDAELGEYGVFPSKAAVPQEALYQCLLDPDVPDEVRDPTDVQIIQN